MKPLIAIATLVVVSPIVLAEDKIDFSRDIRPILSGSCLKCHGPDANKRKADLRLDTKSGAFGERDGGKHAIVPNSSEQSLLFQRITAADEDDRMPPADSGKALTPAQIKLIQRWIDEGASWQGHWAFEAPDKSPLPKVSDEQWPRNAIDHFTLVRMQHHGLSPSPEADRRTLIRRLSLDLRGLPPSPDEVNAFVNDKSENAYESLVDRLMSSPHFGEHVGRYWLDAARFGDTHGLHLDNYREIWPYRDWVFNALNSNMPFDQFTIEQLAGDLLPNATTAQKVATGFNRCHVTTSEGGSIREEVYVRNVTDRVETVGTVFMGLTLGCASCHGHKFDPISQTEFYQMFAFFNSLDGSPLDGNRARHAPFISVPTAEQDRQLTSSRNKLADIDKQIKSLIADTKYVEPKEPKINEPPKPRDVAWFDDITPSGSRLTGDWTYAAKPQPVNSGDTSTVITGTGLLQNVADSVKNLATVGKDDKLFTYVYLDPKNPPKEIMLQWNSSGWIHRAYWGENLIDWGKDNSTQRRRIGDLPKLGEWVRLEVDAMHVGIKPGTKLTGWAFTQFDGTVYWDNAGVVTLAGQQATYDSLAAWTNDQRKAKKTSLPKPIADIVKLADDKGSPQQTKQLTDYFVEHVYLETRDQFASLHAKRTQQQTSMKAIEAAMPVSLVWKETAQPREAFRLIRGQYDQRADKVERKTPDAFPPMNKDLPLNRLGFAKWLVSAEHPLTSRVTVNRFWQQYFGTGLVKTSEDFGTQGDLPTHPNLLDWLAVDFREHGWDIKRLHKLIVMSATYRQSARVTPDHLKTDPDNRLFARGPRFRLDAELLRDQALSISGLLVPTIGGPSVKPPQPAGLWRAVGYSSSNTSNFKRDTGDNVYRRSVYTFWKRTSPPPQMAIFDAPSREACAVRRERTNTPLQALVLMNEVQYVEAARHFAQRIMTEGGDNMDDRLRFAMLASTGREGSKSEIQELKDAHRDHLATFTEDPKAATELVNIGDKKPDPNFSASELAAWTMIANVILNLDEVLNKG